jgi:Mrp family chromosome partitioning ATPase
MDLLTDVQPRFRQLDHVSWLQPLEEGFRLLALNVLQLIDQGREGGQSVVVLSAFSAEGRSRVAASLARAVAEYGLPTGLIDADQVGSGLGEMLDTEVVAGGAERSPFSANGGDKSQLAVVLPDRQLQASRLDFLVDVQHAMAAAVDRGAFVVVDAPACTVSSDGFYLAAGATGVIYVASHGDSEDGVHRDVRSQLELQGARVLGVVLNES